MRFVQLYHTNWDSHGGPGENLQSDFEKVCRDVDQGQAALIRRFEGARLVKGHAGDLGRGIWPHAHGREP